MIQGKVLHCIPDTDMRLSHEGLSELAKKEMKVKVDELRPGEFIMFINTSWTAFKVYCANNVLLYYRRPDGKRLNPKACMEIPHFLRGQDVGYDKALAHVVTSEYNSRYGQPAH